MDAQGPGLAEADAAARLLRDGPNLLPQADGRRWPQILAAVLREPMILMLVAAAVVYLLLGDAAEAWVLLASVGLVAGLAVYQEVRSERALQALRELSSPRARVLREGRARVVAASEVVVGDTVLLEEGDRVPADGRLVAGEALVIDESLLTGESVPVRRSATAGAGGQAQVHASTLVVGGRGTAVVVATGAATTIGRIGTTLRSVVPERSPLQREMHRVVLLFATLGIASCIAVVILYVRAHGDWLQALLAGITLAVANIPEEFPVVLAVFLALGAWRIARHDALVRRPPAIEALGAITVLCVDKTGTLTQNRMAVAEVVHGAAHAPPGPALPAPLARVLQVAAMASQADPTDPMERAILDVAGALPRGERRHAYGLSGDLLATTHAWMLEDGGEGVVACKGAPEAVAGLCGLAGEAVAAVSAQVAAMAERGLRVLGVATAPWSGAADALPLSPRGFAFEWCGLVGLVDPLRPGVPEAVAEATAAGVRVVMLTGDHPQTARAIAAQAGLRRTSAVLTGAQLGALDDSALAEAAAGVDVFARVRPEDKLRLVRALKSAGHVVAMTGDGVNDAPALVAAHVGIAMGARGTDVAREAASIVLLDDDFVTVVRAIRQGRTIYDNLVRAVRYIMAVHVPITGMALLPLLAGAPLVLLPLHVVFLELIIDPAATLVFEREPAGDDVMRRPPRSPRKRLLDAATLGGGLAQGLALFAFVAGTWLWSRHAGLPAGQSAALAFIALVAGNLGLVAANRTAAPGQWRFEANPVFWIVAGGACAMLAIAILVPTVGEWFGFEPPPLLPAGAAALLPVLLPVLLMVAARWLRRSFAVARGRAQRAV